MVINTSLECTAFLTPIQPGGRMVMNTGDSDIGFKLVDIKSASSESCS